MNPSPFRAVLVLFVLSLAALACAVPTGGSQTPTNPLPGIPSATPQASSPTQTSVPQTTAPAVDQVTFYLIALEDGGKSGPPVGCGDSLVEIKQPVTPTNQPIQAALQKLFAIKDQFYGESGLYTALYQSNLAVESVAIQPSGLAEVALTGQMQLGGTCDTPRFKAQIEQTIMAQPGVSAVNVTINGRPLDEVLSEK